MSQQRSAPCIIHLIIFACNLKNKKNLHKLAIADRRSWEKIKRKTLHRWMIDGSVRLPDYHRWHSHIFTWVSHGFFFSRWEYRGLSNESDGFISINYSSCVSYFRIAFFFFAGLKNIYPSWVESLYYMDYFMIYVICVIYIFDFHAPQNETKNCLRCCDVT